MRTGNRVWHWIGVAGLLVWTVLFYRAFARLAIPAFGSAEQAALAARQLGLRYGVWLVASCGLWFGLRVGWYKLLAARQRRKERPVAGSI